MIGIITTLNRQLSIANAWTNRVVHEEILLVTYNSLVIRLWDTLILDGCSMIFYCIDGKFRFSRGGVCFECTDTMILLLLMLSCNRA